MTGIREKCSLFLIKICADFISFAKAKGIYAGINLEGSVVKVRDGLNSAYYGREVRPTDILVKKDVASKGSDDFLATLKKMSISTEQCTS